jgi:fucose 4-O-acetylase-like acetyltransferase
MDAAKYLLMVLVVAGHAVEPLLAGRAIKTGYLLVYAFHMPLFVLLCGHFSKEASVDARRAGRMLTGIVLPYLIFETGYSLFNGLLSARRPEISLLDPYWLMWFLFALALWRAGVPYLARLRMPLVVAVVASLLVGYTSKGGNPAVYRALGLLPFFVLGYLLPRGFHLRLRRPGVRWAGAGAFGVAAVAAWLLAPRVDEVWLFWRASYASLGAGVVEGPLVRLGLLAGGLVLSLAFLAWVPDRPTLARWGRRSMYVFLLHGFVRLGAQRLGLYDHVTSWPGVLVVLAMALALATALSTEPVRRVFRPLVEPVGAWLLAPDVVRVAARS